MTFPCRSNLHDGCGIRGERKRDERDFGVVKNLKCCVLVGLSRMRI